MDKLYRYEEILYSWGLDQFDEPIPGYNMKVMLSDFPIIRRTPKGAWIDLYNEKKFVLLTAIKQYASESKEIALQQFKARKTKQIEILTAKLKQANEALKLAESVN